MGVYGPSVVDVIDGYTLHVEWRQPAIRTGILVRYVIRARATDNANVSIEATFNATVLAGMVHSHVSCS